MVAGRRLLFVAVLVTLAAWLLPGLLRADEVVLFDFEDDADLAHWSQLKLEDKSARGADEPLVKIAFTPEHATRGKQALKLTFSGGK